jgi:hypothetical protein
LYVWLVVVEREQHVTRDITRATRTTILVITRIVVTATGSSHYQSGLVVCNTHAQLIIHAAFGMGTRFGTRHRRWRSSPTLPAADNGGEDGAGLLRMECEADDACASGFGRMIVTLVTDPATVSCLRHRTSWTVRVQKTGCCQTDDA